MIENRPFKILSIDGGGIKGLYTATILKHFEDEFGNPIADYFDMICGTSTGGLIALALSLKIPAKEIADFYYDEGFKIFNYKSPNGIYAKFRQVLFRGKYSDKNLKSAIEKVLGDNTMSDSKTLLCIPSFNLTKGTPRIFKYPHKEGNFCMDKDIKMVDVALATSAAPTYLPIAKVQKELFVDGGVWANNPTLCGLLEATQYFINNDKTYTVKRRVENDIIMEQIKFDSYQILSLASVSHSSGWSMNSKFLGFSFPKIRHRPFLLWATKMFETSLDGQSYFADFFMKGIQKNIKTEGYYFRIPSPDMSSKEHLNDIDLDNATKGSLDLLQKLGDGVGYEYRASQKDKIAIFFQTFKNYQI